MQNIKAIVQTIEGFISQKEPLTFNLIINVLEAIRDSFDCDECKKELDLIIAELKKKKEKTIHAH